jgi:pimeloyl-ACP methyl ester carboxylesterase
LAVPAVRIAAGPLLLLVCGCAAPPPLPPYTPPGPVRGVVFAVDGAGGFQGNLALLQRAAAEERLPVAVRPFCWTHGYGRILADQRDLEHIEASAGRLAEELACQRRQTPELPLFVVAHSAGSAVALEAMKAQPPDGLERLVLIAPSVSAGYDLRPALRACRGGVEVFYSERDVLELGVGAAVAGNADHAPGPPAGRIGFRPDLPCADLPLLARLRQHPWDPCVAWSGNRGRHSDGYQPAYLKVYVLPLLQ